MIEDSDEDFDQNRSVLKRDVMLMIKLMRSGALWIRPGSTVSTREICQSDIRKRILSDLNAPVSAIKAAYGD